MQLFLLITVIFFVLAVVVGVSFDLVKKNLDEDAPEEIKMFHTTYFVGIIEVMLIYLYFLVVVYAIDKPFIEGLVMFLTLVASLIVLVFSADAARKIEKNKDKYKQYYELMAGLAGISGIVFFVLVIRLGIGFFGKKRQQKQK